MDVGTGLALASLLLISGLEVLVISHDYKLIKDYYGEN